MPLYFFSLEDGRKLSDDIGEDLADDEAARAAGLQVARELAHAKANPGDLRVVVRSADQSVVCEVQLVDAQQSSYRDSLN